MKKYVKQLIIVIILIMMVIALLFIGYSSISNIVKTREREGLTKDITFEAYSNENDILKILVIAEDMENGIDKLLYLSEQGEEKEIIGQGKTKIALDYEVKKDGNYEFKFINNIGEEIVKTLTVMKIIEII